jgi:hypothetical protein
MSSAVTVDFSNLMWLGFIGLRIVLSSSLLFSLPPLATICSASAVEVPLAIASSDTTRLDRLITSDIGVVSVASASSPSQDTLAVDRTLTISVFTLFKPEMISSDEAFVWKRNAERFGYG